MGMWRIPINIGRRRRMQSGKGSASFLKKRSKKLLSIGAQSVGPGSKGRSFLLLFFKKEALPIP
jgi:hypothetical protein